MPTGKYLVRAGLQSTDRPDYLWSGVGNTCGLVVPQVVPAPSLGVHSRHGRPNFLGTMRLKNEVTHIFKSHIMCLTLLRYSRITYTYVYLTIPQDRIAHKSYWNIVVNSTESVHSG